MHSRLLDEHKLDSYLSSGVLASLIVHLLLVSVSLQGLRGLNTSSIPEIEAPLMVSFIPPPASVSKPQTQMVSPPEQSLPRPPPADAFLSDKDASTDTPQLKRGDDPSAGATISRQPAPQANAAKAASAASNSAPKALSKGSVSNPAAKGAPGKSAGPQLALDSQTIYREFIRSGEETSEDRLRAALNGGSASQQTASMAATQPFSRASGSGAQILGSRGSPDYIPTLPDGDITLLNAKANLYAVFVRRVAIQVFSNLRASGWERLSAADIRRMSDDTTVTAVLSPAGVLLKVSLASSSGSPRFDEVLTTSVQRGARDPNPPKEAALDDGNIHFIFKARSWVQPGSDPRTGAPSERRWLVLGTGLE